MSYTTETVFCAGPDSPHAFDIIPLQSRLGTLDAPCPICKGHGQWNVEIDLASFRCRREPCGHCYGAGWIETGDDPIALLDIVMAPEGYPKWIVRYVARPDGDGATPG